MGDVNKQRRNFISLTAYCTWIWCLGIQPQEGSPLFDISEWVGIIAIKTERTQIHFLSDVLIAVASLDLKVPIILNSAYACSDCLTLTELTRLGKPKCLYREKLARRGG